MAKETTKQKPESMKHVEWWFLFSILVIILVTVFALTNASPAPVRFFLWTFELSLALLIFISAAIGAVIAISLGLVKQLRNRKRFKELEKKVATLEMDKTFLTARVAELEAGLEKKQRDAGSHLTGDTFTPDHITDLKDVDDATTHGD